MDDLPSAGGEIRRLIHWEQSSWGCLSPPKVLRSQVERNPKSCPLKSICGWSCSVFRVIKGCSINLDCWFTTMMMLASQFQWLLCSIGWAKKKILGAWCFVFCLASTHLRLPGKWMSWRGVLSQATSLSLASLVGIVTNAHLNDASLWHGF